MEVLAVDLPGERPKPEPTGQELGGKYGADAFTSPHPEVQERFEAEFFQYRRVRFFAAALPGHEVGRHAGFCPHSA